MPPYTVHNTPFYLKPLLWLFGWIGGMGFILLNSIFRHLSKIEWSGQEHLDHTPNHIFCLWHENLPLFFIAHRRFDYPFIMMSFPLWYMKPVHVMKNWIGIRELAYGASGHDGKAALQQVIGRLQEGYSTMLNPDGPYGPAKKAKVGALVMSLKSGTPIIPVRFHVKKDWRINSWDRKRYPRFFSTWQVIYGEPLYVTETNFEEMKNRLVMEMSDGAYT